MLSMSGFIPNMISPSKGQEELKKTKTTQDISKPIQHRLLSKLEGKGGIFLKSFHIQIVIEKDSNDLSLRKAFKAKVNL